MDRGEGQNDNLASLDGLEGVAAGASTRVGEILAEAERLARKAHAEADRAAAEARRDAEREIERIATEAREAARAAARKRVDELAALQAALTARGPAVVEGLEGAGLTRARLEAVIAALGAAADEVTAEAEDGDPRAGARQPSDETEAADAEPDDAQPAEEASTEPETAASPEPEAAASPEPEAAAGEGATPADPVAAAEDLAKPVAGAVPDPPSEDGDGGPPVGDGNGNGNGSFPEGAPLARKPKRSRERDARFAALLLAVQGRPRNEVEAHLRSEYGFADVEPILDEVFGRTTA